MVEIKTVILIMYLYILPVLGIIKAYKLLNGKLSMLNLIFAVLPIVNVFVCISIVVNPHSFTDDEDYDFVDGYTTPKKTYSKEFLDKYTKSLWVYIPVFNIFELFVFGLTPLLNIINNTKNDKIIIKEKENEKDTKK